MPTSSVDKIFSTGHDILCLAQIRSVLADPEPFPFSLLDDKGQVWLCLVSDETISCTIRSKSKLSLIVNARTRKCLWRIRTELNFGRGIQNHYQFWKAWAPGTEAVIIRHWAVPNTQTHTSRLIMHLNIIGVVQRRQCAWKLSSLSSTAQRKMPQSTIHKCTQPLDAINQVLNFMD